MDRPEQAGESAVNCFVKSWEDFDQGQNVKILTLANFAHFLRGTQQAIESTKEVFPPYLDLDGSLTHVVQHPGMFDHMDLMTVCSDLHTLVLELNSSAFWEPATQDDDILAPPIAPINCTNSTHFGPDYQPLRSWR